jgi:hypothetical protein
MHTMSQQDVANCHARLTERFNNKDALGVWSIVNNNANKVSRKHVSTLDPANAPKVTASNKAWRAWVASTFPDFEAKMIEKSANYEKERTEREKAWEVRQNEALAYSGRPWMRNGKRYENSYALVQALLAESFRVVNTGIGVVQFQKDDIVVGPFRNKNINAAIRLLIA